MIKFLAMRIQGFRSIVDFSYRFTDGLTILQGPNGSGKSSMIEAIFWCLSGKTLKGTKAEKIQTYKQFRPEGFKGTRVAVTL